MMKTKTKRVIVLLALCGLLAGCSGVRLSAEYSTLLDRTATLSSETASRAERGQLTPDEMTSALSAQARTWRLFQDARDGRKSGER